MASDYLTNTPLDQALENYTKALSAAGCCLRPIAQRPSRSACGLITAAPVYARRNVPHYLASAMDGIAVRASDTFGATETTPVCLDVHQFTVVDTGDAIPADCDCVIMIEEIVWQTDETQVLLYQSAAPWQHIRQIGEDFCSGDMLLTSAVKIDAAAVGLMLAGGVHEVDVVRKLHAAIIPTGDEIVPAASKLKPGDIPEYNAAMLAAALSDLGIESTVQPIVPDDPQQITTMLRDSLHASDFVLLLAGSSAGRDDYSSRVIGELGEIIVHGLAIKPGKPAILAICDKKPVIGMPGYPVSALMVFDQILLPLLREQAGLAIPHRPVMQARLSRRLLSSLKYEEFVRVRLSQIGNQWQCIPMERGAGMLNSFLRADGILSVDQNCEGLEAGSLVDVRLLKDPDLLLSAVSIVGSHDPLLDELAELYQRKTGNHLSSTHVGSLGGLMALKRKETLIAPIHLLDPNSGQYNWTEIERFFPDHSVLLVEGVERVQGLMVQKGNPLDLHTISDLIRSDHAPVRYVNRQAGSGTRVLFDFLLAGNQIDADKISGYEREETTHTGVAAQIAEGSADVGMGILSAARTFDLDFIPLVQECYDFAIRADSIERREIQELIQLLNSKELCERLDQMGGYRINRPGTIIDLQRSLDRVITTSTKGLQS